MNKLSSSLLVLALSAVAAPAFAADNGWYLGVDLGQSNYAAMKPFVTNRAQGFNTTGSATATATAAGLDVGYQFLRYFAVEAGYQDFGSATGDLFYPFQDHLEIHAKGETLFAVGILPLSDRFSLFGKAGLLAYSQDYSSDVYGLQNSYSHTTPAIGVGASYAFDDRFSLRLGFTRFHAVGNANENDRGAIDLSYLQLLVHF